VFIQTIETIINLVHQSEKKQIARPSIACKIRLFWNYCTCVQGCVNDSKRNR